MGRNVEIKARVDDLDAMEDELSSGWEDGVAGKPEGKSADKPTDKPADKPTDKPTDKPADD